jgi:hypothetical protein
MGSNIDHVASVSGKDAMLLIGFVKPLKNKIPYITNC